MKLTYEWDFGLLYKSEVDFKKDIKESEELINQICGFQGKLNTKENIVSYLVITEKLMKKICRLDLYASLKVDKDTRNAEYLKNYQVVNNLITNYSVKTAFVSPELSKNSDEFLLELYNDKDLTSYARVFEGIIKEKPHTISKEKEELIAGMGDFSDFMEAFKKLTTAEMKFEDVVVDGKKEKLNDATYSKFTKNENAEVRRQAYNNLLKGYSEFNLTISNNFINHLKKENFISKTYAFNSTIDRLLFHEEVNRSVFDKLLENVTKNLVYYHKYLKQKAKCLGLEKLSVSDISAPITKGDFLNLDYDIAVQKVLDALKILGKDYYEEASNMFTNGSIDVFPSEGKNSGGFSASAQIGEQFILLNYNKSYFDFSTIAHEIGHSMHSYYSEKCQPYYNQNYVIFVAEIASTVNEVILAKKLLKEAKDNNERRYIADNLLKEFCAAVFNQSLYSEFELYVHDCVNNDISISCEELNYKYDQLQQKYLSDVVELTPYSKYGWSRISHFYRNFYVFKYATGFISAVSIVKQIENKGADYVEHYYKKFLSAGSCADPITILKYANVDITTDEPYKEAFKFFEELLELIK